MIAQAPDQVGERPSISARGDAQLAARGLGKSFGGFRAVDNVSLTIARNEVKAVIGPNGAGKSTLFSCLAGTLRPSDGQILLDGDDVTSLPVHRRVQRGLVKSFQTTSIFQAMTVADNLMTSVAAVCRWSLRDIFGSPWRRADVRERVDQAMELVGLDDRRNVVAATLSHGDQRKLEIGLALACGARILLLDEPTAGMGIDDVKAFCELVERLRSTCGILLVEHNMDIVLRVSDRITVLAQGQTICEGTPDEVRRDDAVRKAYLGRREI
ncbi:ABC transporter ATP-binding protein [Bradyrhizobium sp.]|uniref:ABC transporter ATP-binding protein n=1 Tax=Bradyrhizobium sp. TaxID=376 RepID=UPI0039E2D6F7